MGHKYWLDLKQRKTGQLEAKNKGVNKSMYTLKLYTGWINKAEEKIRTYTKGKWKTKRRLSKKQVKEIYNLIKTAKVIEDTNEYKIYTIET